MANIGKKAKGRALLLPPGTRVREHYGAQNVRVPKLLEATAKEIAEAFYDDDFAKYERGVRTEIFRTRYPNRQEYVDNCWPHWLKDARSVLGEMLGASNTPQEQKDAIYEALTGGFETVTQFLPPPHVLYGPDYAKRMN